MADTNFLLERDALNGKEGKGFAVIDGKKLEIFRFKNIQFKATFEQVVFKVVGTVKRQRKTTGIDMTGSFVVYFGMREWSRMVKKFLNTGKHEYFELQIEMNDPNSTIGAQIINITKCKITECDVLKLDVDADFLEQAVSFTALDFEFIEQFNDPAEYGSNNYTDDYPIVIEKPYPGKPVVGD